MKAIKNKKEETQNEMSLVDQESNSKPEFASREEALAFYTGELEAFAKQCGRPIKEMLRKWENSPEFDEECDKAMDLWRTISLLKRKV